MFIAFVRENRRLAALIGILWLSVASAIGALCGNSYWFDVQARDEGLLVITNALSPTHFLPRSYIGRIRALGDVTQVTEFSSVGMFVAHIGDPIGGLIVDKDGVEQVLPRLGVAPRAWIDWKKDRNSVLVSDWLADQLNLSPGSELVTRIIAGPVGMSQTFLVAGTFKDDSEVSCRRCLILGREFVDETIPSYVGVVSTFLARVSNGANSDLAAARIDAQFQNEDFPTRSSAFRPSTSDLLRGLIDLRAISFVALGLILATAASVPAIVVYLLAVRNARIFALYFAIGYSRRSTIKIIGLTSLVVVTFISLISFAIVAFVGEYASSHQIPWLVLENGAMAIAGAVAASIVCVGSAGLAVVGSIRSANLELLFSEEPGP